MCWRLNYFSGLILAKSLCLFTANQARFSLILQSIKTVRIALYSLALLLFLAYFLLGGVGLSMGFYGPWGGMGAHHDPPPALVTFVLWLFALGSGGVVLFSILVKSEFEKPSWQVIQRWAPVGILAVIVLLWLAFGGLHLMDTHRMIVDMKGPHGGTMGESNLEPSFLTRLLLFLLIPMMFISLCGGLNLIALPSERRRGMQLLYLLNIVLGLAWIGLFFLTCQKVGYLY